MTTATEAKRTPGPWRTVEYNNTVQIVRPWDALVKPSNQDAFGSCYGVCIAHNEYTTDGVPTPEQARANAAFIVRACNAHDELIAALRKSLDDREVLTVALVAFVTAAEGGATTFFHSKGGCLDVAYKALRNVGKASGMKLGDFDTEFVTGARAALARATGE